MVGNHADPDDTLSKTVVWNEQTLVTFVTAYRSSNRLSPRVAPESRIELAPFRKFDATLLSAYRNHLNLLIRQTDC